MSLHYILDGYNIIKSSNIPLPPKLEDQRFALIKFIQEKKLCGSKNNRVTVVFDAEKRGINCLRQEALGNQNIKVVFTSQESADQRIKEIVENSKHPKRIIVVSDDKEIGFFIKSCGAALMSTRELANKANLKPKRIKSPRAMELSYTQAAEINRELKRIWLKGDEG